MALIANNLVNSVKFDNLPNELADTISSTPEIMNMYLANGWGKIRSDFEVREQDDRTPLLSMEVMDIMRVASDDFDPSADAVKFGARLPTFNDIDIDLSLRRSDLINFYRTYLKNVIAFQSLDALISNPWPLFFAEQILEKAGRDLAYNSTFRGVKNPAVKGSLTVMNGLIYKFAEGRGSGGDIPTDNVKNIAAMTANDFDADVYDQTNELAQLTESNPDISGRPMTVYMSAPSYRKYKATRREKSPNTISLSEQPAQLDDFPHIKIKVEEGLGNKRFQFISLPKNLFFVLNENYQNFNAKMIENVKGWEANFMFSADVNYGVGKYLFMNNRTD